MATRPHLHLELVRLLVKYRARTDLGRRTMLMYRPRLDGRKRQDRQCDRYSLVPLVIPSKTPRTSEANVDCSEWKVVW